VVFSKPVRCGFLAFWTVLIISSESSNVFQTFSSFQSEKDIIISYSLLISSQHANRCYLFCLFCINLGGWVWMY